MDSYCDRNLQPTNRVASLYLVEWHLGSREPGVPSAVAQLHEQPFVGRAAEVTFTQVTAVRSCGYFLVLPHTVCTMFHDSVQLLNK